MPSTYTGLGVQLMATGEKAGTWGTLTNTNWNIMEQISGGYISQALSTTGDTLLAVNDGTTGAALATRVIELTGALAGNVTLSLPLDVENWFIIKNSTTNAYSVEFQYTSGSGSSVTWSATDKGTKIVYAKADDGTDPNIVDVMATSSEITLANNNALIFNDADNSAAVTLDVPTAVSGSYTLTLPAAVGAAADYALTTSDGAGNTQWTATSTFGISTGKAIAMAMIFG